MQNNRSPVGPQGLAMLILVGGAALASPFLRTPQVDLTESITESPLAYPGVPGRLASAQLPYENSDPLPVNVTNFTELLDDSSSAGRLGEPKLPPWAVPPSPLDHLISKGTAPPWRHEVEHETRKIQPLEAWVGGAQMGRSQVTLEGEAGLTANTQPLQSAPLAVPPWPTPNLREPMTAQVVTPQAVGSLTGTSLSPPNPASPPQTRSQPASPPAATPPARAQFVFQPGFHQNAPQHR